MLFFVVFDGFLDDCYDFVFGVVFMEDFCYVMVCVVVVGGECEIEVVEYVCCDVDGQQCFVWLSFDGFVLEGVEVFLEWQYELCWIVIVFGDEIDDFVVFGQCCVGCLGE